VISYVRKGGREGGRETGRRRRKTKAGEKKTEASERNHYDVQIELVD